MYRASLSCCLLGLLMIPLQACGIMYSAEPIEAWVVDAETKEPIEGVVVTANWQLEEGTFGGNVQVGQLMVMETATGKDGKFAFPSWGPKLALSSHLVNRDPQLLLFKSGYEYRGLQNAFTVDYNKGMLRRSEWNGKTIQIKKFKGSLEGYAERVYGLSQDISLMLDFARGDKECNWKKVPRMLVALDKMSVHFEGEGVKLKAWRGGQHILKIEDIPAQCGSPNEFLRSYLQ